MIINIRGTSGSGKSTIVKDLMKGWPERWRIPHFAEGRKQPLGYWLERMNRHPIAVLGHYESACGGCDTLPGYDRIFELIRLSMKETKKQAAAEHVLFEGLLVSEEVRRTQQLHDDGFDLRVILLQTPVEECLASIRARREARGDARPLKEDNTRNRVATIERSCHKLEEAGVRVHRTTRQGAAELVREWLS